jgi:hypothetical protein
MPNSRGAARAAVEAPPSLPTSMPQPALKRGPLQPVKALACAPLIFSSGLLRALERRAEKQPGKQPHGAAKAPSSQPPGRAVVEAPVAQPASATIAVPKCYRSMPLRSCTQ